MRAKKLLMNAARVAGVLVFLVVLLWMGGAFDEAAIQPGVLAAPAGVQAPAHSALAQRTTREIRHEAVGTIRSRTRVTVTPQVSGQVISLAAQEGEAVEAGVELAVLESREFEARLEQARSSLAAAEAGAVQARAHAARIEGLFEQEAATSEQLEAARSGRARAEAETAAAAQRVLEAEITLSYTHIASPLTGVVAERLVETGDLAWPGRPMYVVHVPDDLRLEASVREGLISRLSIGDELPVFLTSVGTHVEGRVDEIVPSADPGSRSFLVRVDVPAVPGLFPGMFARLEIPGGLRETVVVPAEAVARVGQLRTVLVQVEDHWERRYVTTGEADGPQVEVLSGLDGGETIGW